MASQQPGDQHQQSQYVPVPTDPVHQQQQVQNALSSVPAAPSASTGNYPAFDLGKFWTEQMQLADMFESDFKNHPLPLARIKKVMKTDQEVKMISAEAPVLFAKGCEIFITELTKRAWVHAEENKRRTLQRSDIATAISKTDMCDFLIDIVPREEAVKTQSTPFDQQQQQQPQPQQPEYGSYYPAQGGVPQYAPQQSMEAAAYASYSQLTAEQMQQYQLQLQQFAAQQQQQQHAYPHGTESSTAAQQSSTTSNPTTKTE
ncbi:Transcriptional activator hap5 [Mucor circinelloides]